VFSKSVVLGELLVVVEEEDDPSRAASLVLEVFERWAEEARQRDQCTCESCPFPNPSEASWQQLRIT
jgi:hypothetical protein